MFLRGSRVPTQITGPSSGTAGRGVQSGAPLWQMAMRPGSTPSRAVTCAATVRDTVTTRSARRACAADERRVIAADLGGRGLGMIEEEQVVDGHDLRGPPGREQQGRRGVRHVDAAGQPLDGRPPEPVPGPVQGAHRNAGIPARDAGAGATRRSFQLLEKTSTWCPGGAVAASASAVRCTYSPTPVRARSAGR